MATLGIQLKIVTNAEKSVWPHFGASFSMENIFYNSQKLILNSLFYLYAIFLAYCYFFRIIWTLAFGLFLSFTSGSEFGVGLHPIHKHLFRIFLRIASNAQRVL